MTTPKSEYSQLKKKSRSIYFSLIYMVYFIKIGGDQLGAFEVSA